MAQPTERSAGPRATAGGEEEEEEFGSSPNRAELQQLADRANRVMGKGLQQLSAEEGAQAQGERRRRRRHARQLPLGCHCG